MKKIIKISPERMLILIITVVILTAAVTGCMILQFLSQGLAREGQGSMSIQIPLENTSNNVSRETPQELSLEAFHEVNVRVDPMVIYLYRPELGCNRTMTMVTTEAQTYSIQMGLEKKVEFRPLVHDIVKDAFDNFGINVLGAKIEKLEKNTYFSKLILQHGSSVLTMDSKPSDAIAIAVRSDAPIYINRNLLEDYGELFC